MRQDSKTGSGKHESPDGRLFREPVLSTQNHGASEKLARKIIKKRQ
jgi:hypothetical protein